MFSAASVSFRSLSFTHFLGSSLLQLRKKSAISAFDYSPFLTTSSLILTNFFFFFRNLLAYLLHVSTNPLLFRLAIAPTILLSATSRSWISPLFRINSQVFFSIIPKSFGFTHAPPCLLLTKRYRILQT